MDSYSILQYLIVLIVLFTGILTYFRIADKNNIIDKPNRRSSHNYITIRGGGIIFWLAGVLFSLQHLPESRYFLTGLTLICGVSLWDDISSLPNKIRIIIHFLSISLIFYGLNLFSSLPIWMIFIAYVFFVGVINAYNFMDGINGITGLYSLVILICLQYVNREVVAFVHPDFINYALLACLVFLVFNFRKKARCFAGDVGSVGISFWIVFLLLQLMLATNSVVWILFLSLYGVDSICTILHRIYLKQNIFQPHRLHFYQILSNECGISHRTVSILYAIVQLILCITVIYTHTHSPNWSIGIYFSLLLLLSAIYLLKIRLMKEKVSSD